MPILKLGKRFLEKQREKREQVAKLKGIERFQINEERKASPKKLEELKVLCDWLVLLVEKYDFTVENSWSNATPDESLLQRKTNCAELNITTYVDFSGVNYDRIGKITIHMYWYFEGAYDEKTGEDKGEVDKERDFSLKKAIENFPEIYAETFPS